MSSPRFDFANILFAGSCNRRCPWCIGEELPQRVNVPNLGAFPPAGLEAFIAAVNADRTPEIVFTGTVTDPQLYRHEEKLLQLLRRRLHPAARFSVHTNGAMALRKLKAFNDYDRACLSIPSFDPDIYEAMMGSREIPDVAAIIAAARIPVKISCAIDAPNAASLEPFLMECRGLGLRRVVLRRLLGETRAWELPESLKHAGVFRGNPVFDFGGMEVTYWDFNKTRCRSLNLFADGTLGESYLLTKTGGFPGNSPLRLVKAPIPSTAVRE